MWGEGCQVWVLGFEFCAGDFWRQGWGWDTWFGVEGFGFKIQGFDFWVQGLGFRGCSSAGQITDNGQAVLHKQPQPPSSDYTW